MFMIRAANRQFIGTNQVFFQSIRFATKKAGGSSKNGRDSAGKRLGVKKLGGERVSPGYIIYRQRGQQMRCGPFGVKMGRDHTIYSVAEGWVYFRYDRFRKRQTISVLPINPNQLTTAQRTWVYNVALKRENFAEATALADKFRNNPLAALEVANAVKAEFAAKESTESANA